MYSIINLVTSMLNMEQIESTMYLNQYLLGSKALTSAVQSYAVTGEQRYYDDYMNELNVEKNRDVAWAGLKKNDITDEEWEMLEQIAATSNGLVPLEEQAMVYAAVERGSAMADETAETMLAVMEGAGMATDKMQLVAEALLSEAQNMISINENITRVSDIVDNNSATSQETAAVSEEQSANVSTMVQMMDQFKI